ncbi:hypothetical protein DACRYDRAFT_50827 [Dacryopinax primogenitus]|uniref:FAS1 domain-containing protein n=1 Tax=Dacryopinax primogenitus (strain DJM 731) TaxID=1858805 RepID=M5G3N5_DACPD|nr:uncharacterized protein DACRYDRAFT_50827 [Dacryopinax primogenitus]EJU02830.1 hypothetical protein DACRYDRAFT_50827 [Dacryopinax primogenitus]
MGDQVDTDAPDPTFNPPTLADILTVRSAGSIWYDYAREVESVSLRLSDTSAMSKSTLLVPVNKAVLALHRKPHEGPAPDGDDMEITDEKTRVNVERWVSVHIIPVCHLLSRNAYPTLLDGRHVYFKQISESGWKWEQYAVNGTIRILDQVHASNGDIYFINGVLDV